MGTKVKAPKARDYGKETRDTLQAQIDLMPQLFAAESKFQPQYAQMEMDIANKMTPQMLDLYQNQIDPALRQMQSAQRESDVSDIEQLGPRAMEALDKMDPQKAKLMKTMMSQAQEGVDAGGRLTGMEQRQYQQNVRGGQAARGLGMGASDAAYEAAELQLGGERRRGQRQQNAYQALATRHATTADPFMAVLGRSSQNAMQSQSIMGQAQGMGPGQLFNPESGYAGAIHGGNYQGILAARTATASNKSAMWGAGISALGSLGGGAVKKYCWVAREVFGETNPKWMAFYVWKENFGPGWLRWFYNRYGEWFARFIRNKPSIKACVRRAMERVIGD